ncbi:glycosyltransferase family 4 protein [Streptomyces spirodelae]|uniref:D-inositol 3-phosphate glycosyltransferase n=1 Tax=Streptomyces spirodelae TaxID=2812904 RepID=A0ABS3WNM0_9ACTN|nr:glycosyltransferase [Streptomyces spirodelae]MBO8184711.1 glycosyltransferase [Streptomyces spirodelae]
MKQTHRIIRRGTARGSVARAGNTVEAPGAAEGRMGVSSARKGDERPRGRPRLAVVVGNTIAGDSRVQKTAIAAARAGWDVTLVGRSPSKRREESVLGPVRVIKVPVGADMRAVVAAARRRPQLRSRLTQFGLPDDSAWVRARAAHAAWVREQTARVGWLSVPSGGRPAPWGLRTPEVLPAALARQLAREALKGWVRVRRYAHKGRGRAYRWERRRTAGQPQPTGDWRVDWPELLDIDLAFGPVIEEIEPDVIHANDHLMIAVGARSAARLRARGRPTRWLYDAHEYIRGVEWPDAVRASAFPGVEEEFIGKADAVVTVSQELAGILREAYALPADPLVVANAPVRETVSAGTDECVSVRDACGLSPDVPLLVYAGWIGPERGLDTAVEGLAELPHAHLALVAGKQNATLQGLLARAEELGVRQRVHVVPYVRQEQVPDYLSSADLGLICFRHVPNCEISLPTKAAEYLHAGLPMITSGVRTLRNFVERTGIGEVFVTEDVPSFVAAVQRGLAKRGTLAARITEPLLQELSWEQQSAGLLNLYEQLAGPAAAARLAPRSVPWSASEQPGLGAARAHAQESAAPGGTPAGWRTLGSTPVRLGMGCANSAGQLAGFARALCERRQDLSAEVVMHTHDQSVIYPADIYAIGERTGDLGFQLDRARRVLGSYTHYLADSFTPALGRLNGGHIQDDLPSLSAAGIKVALLAHGSDVRDPQRHMSRYEHSLFHAADEQILRALAKKSARNRRMAAQSGLPQFVTTPDLLEELPGARWAPLVVDVEGWASQRPAMERARPVVVHAPSKRWTKGTERVVPVLEEMDRRGLIEFRMVTGVPWTEVRELVKEADIVVDQFAVGTYGTFACEGMAAGRPVIAFLDERLHRSVGIRPPIVNATPGTLRGALESLLEDRDFAMRTAQESAEYVRTYHDGSYTADVLDGFLR